jgi:pilus assembly protein CpaF
MAGVELPLLAIRKQIASAIDLVIQIKRFRSGHRRIVSIAEVTGMEGETVTLQDIFAFEEDRFKCTGFVPTFVDRLRANGIDFPTNYFA